MPPYKTVWPNVTDATVNKLYTKLVLVSGTRQSQITQMLISSGQPHSYPLVFPSNLSPSMLTHQHDQCNHRNFKRSLLGYMASNPM